MRIGISFKWTVSAVLLVILVVAGYTYFTISDTQSSVENETQRIQRIQYDALNTIGGQTTMYVSLPASSLLYDNDKTGLEKLISPIVDTKDDANSYYAVYATIIDPNGRVWVAAVNENYSKLEMAETSFFDRSRSEPAIDEVSKAWLDGTTAGKTFPLTEDVVRKVTDYKGNVQELKTRQYIHEIKSGDEKQGYLVVGYSIDGLQKEIDTIKSHGMERQREAMDRAMLLALIAVGFGIVLGVFQALLVTRNITKLSKAASQIANGDLSVRTSVHTHDEIGQLSEQFNFMADQVVMLLHETEQKAMLEKEIYIARNIQSTLLPANGVSQCGPVKLNGLFQPASECGGDLWSYDRLADGSVLLTMGDVTGHGVPSAMITACAKSALDTLLELSQNRALDLGQIARCLNVAVCKSAKRTLFMTFQAMRISADGKRAELVNCGHNFPLLVHHGEVKGLVARGERLGDSEESVYESISVPLEKGDTLLFYTDGLIEYQNESGQEYGEKRLRKVISGFGNIGVEQAMNELCSDFNAFCGNAPQNDDITLMFARV